MYTKYWLLLATLSSLAFPLHAADAIEWREVLIQNGQGGSSRIQVFEFRNGALKADLVLSTALKTTDMRANIGVSVQDAKNLPAVDRWMKREMLLVNGGYSGYSTDRPDGLLIVGGSGVALPNLATIMASTGGECPGTKTERLKLAGLLCIGPDDQIDIRKFSIQNYSDCYHALQAGPLLVESPKHVGVCQVDANYGSRAIHRTVICTVENRRVKLMVSVDPIDLYPLAQWLGKPESQGGAGCELALNLSGGNAAGAIYTDSLAFRPDHKPRYWGPGNHPVPSMLIIHQH